MFTTTRRAGTVVLGLSVILLAATAGPALGAGSPRQSLIRGFVQAFNSGDTDTMMAFYAEHATEEFLNRRSDDEDRKLYQRLSGDLGTLDVQDVNLSPSGAVSLSAMASGMPGARAVFDLTLEGNPPRLAGFRVSVEDGGGPESDLPPLDVASGASMAEVGVALDGYFKELAGQDLFSGAVLLAQGGKTVWSGAYGLANRERNIPNRMSTRFDVGSITKAMTKTAIGQLARDGKLRLEDTLLTHLPDYPDTDIAGRITIGQLLDHTSGLGDIFNERYADADRSRLRTPRDFFPLFAGKPLMFQPGTDSSYSNAGYVVLGAVVEAVSGMRYDSYLQKKIFSPAGMKHSGFPARDGRRPDVAVGYTAQEPDRVTTGSAPAAAGLQPNIGRLPIRGCPAGSSSHTAEDLARFDRALRDGTLLGPVWSRWFFTGGEPDGDAGFAPGSSFVDHPIGIAGGGPGVNATLESGGETTLVILANIDPPVAEHIARRLRAVPQLKLN